jgi:hypothetical protein
LASFYRSRSWLAGAWHSLGREGGYLMRGLLILCCRSFPGDHRARRSDEVVDTALLVADGSILRTAREAISLVVAGLRQRLRAESHRSLRDGVALLAGVLAIVNLAVALAGILSGFGAFAGPSVYLWKLWYGPGSYPFVIDGWWIAFAAAGAAVVFGLARGHRRLAIGAAVANLALVAYDGSGLYESSYGPTHFAVFTFTWRSSFPGGGQWLLPAIVLAVATAAARPRRLSLARLPLALVVVVLLAWLAVPSRETGGAFFYLRWPLAAIILLGVAFGAVAPRLALLACGITLAAIPGIVPYLIGPHPRPHSSLARVSQSVSLDPAMIVVAAAGLALGPVLLAQLARRRLT